MRYSVSPSSTFHLKISHIFFIGLVALTLSYNFHALWLLYDVGSILLIGYFIQTGRFSLSIYKALMLLVVCSYFAFNIVKGGHYLEGILSLWDTIKHIPYLMYAAWFLKFTHPLKQDLLLKKLYLFLLALFFIQVVVVVVQFLSGVFFDNIAGTFGDGGSHAIGYISILVIAASQRYSKRLWLKSLIILFSIMINLFAENAGFFVLLMFLGVGIFMSHKINFKTIVLFLLLLATLYPALSSQLYSEKSFFTVISGRLIDVVTPSSLVNFEEARGRSDFLLIASVVGGWFGAGVGSFSSIYMMEGSGVERLNGIQINITEASHLVAESGFIGLLLIIVLYLLFVKDLSNIKKYQVYYSFFFTACMFYSAVLMNESHIFMLLLTFVYLSSLTRKDVNFGFRL